MYSSCTFCYSSLGRNELIEACPVGSRLAYDMAKGRLWIVCRRCGRWNLSPLEERWEAIADAERTFERLTVRAATDNIGLARSADGTDLIRVGSAPRVEISTWRYSDVFTRRWKRSAAMGGLVLGASAVAIATGSYLSLFATVPGASLLLQVPGWAHMAYDRRRVAARLRDPSGQVAVVSRKQARAARLVSTGGEAWELCLAHSLGEARLTGTEALHIAAPLLTLINAQGARKGVIEEASRVADEHSETETALGIIAGRNRVHPMGGWPTPQHLAAYSRPDRLALEIIVTRDVETRALDGELEYLERAWREADEIASIADDLLVPESIRQRADALKREV
jgi:hypothetical protein